MNVDLNLPEDRANPRPGRKSKRVWVGGTPIGDGAPIAVQSMCTTLTHDIDATIRQIAQLQEGGCEIARVAVPDKRAGEALKELVRRSILPVVADIHFDYRLALMALDAKVHKLRLDPLGRGHERPAVRGHRRHDPRFAVRRSGRRGEGRFRPLEIAGPARPGPYARRLSVVRSCGHRPHPAGEGRRGALARASDPDEGRGHGL